jgi:hypothetical protein
MSPTGKPRVKTTPPQSTPKQPKPWDPPPPPNRGDATDLAVFAAVGRALTEWEKFEDSFANLFARFMGMEGDALPASRAYGSIVSFRSRCAMVKAAADAFFLKEKESGAESHISKIIEFAEGLAPRRNEIAHGIVQHFDEPDGFVSTPAGGVIVKMKRWGYAIAPPRHSTGKTTIEISPILMEATITVPKYRYTSAEIGDFANMFSTLARETEDVGKKLIRYLLHKHLSSRRKRRRRPA